MKVFEIIIRKCLGYRKGECLLIVCDDKKRELAQKFYRASKALGAESVLMQMPERRMHGEEPPATIAGALQRSDLAVLLTSKSLSHTKARKEASKRFGTRIASLPGATEEMLKRAIPVDYSALSRRAARLSRILTRGKRVEIYTGRGTSLTMSIKGRKGFADNGLYRGSGSFGNLPAGEACIGPCEGTTEGRLVVDGSMPLTGRLKRPIEIIFKKGYAQDIPVPQMTSLVRSLGKCALSAAELGIGLNPKAKVTGIVLEDEKAIGTAHVALGNNRSFGGKVSCASHLDFVFLDPIIVVDGVKLKGVG